MRALRQAVLHVASGAMLAWLFLTAVPDLLLSPLLPIAFVTTLAAIVSALGWMISIAELTAMRSSYQVANRLHSLWKTRALIAGWVPPPETAPAESVDAEAP